MTKSKKIALLVASVIILALLIVAAVTDGAMATVACPDCTAETAAECETCAGETNVRGSIWALLPPVIAIGLALITKEVYSSLFIGVVSGALLYSNFSFTGTMDAVTTRGLGVKEMDLIADYITRTIRSFDADKDAIKAGVREICGRFPLYE